MNTDKRNWVEIYYLVILLITGLSLRFFRLGNESFSPLEASYIAALSKNFNNLLVYLITHKNISFCFSFAGFLWLKLFSYSEYSARLLSVLFGIGGILFCFKSLRFFYRSKISFFISLFLCCSPLYVQISQQFSPYAMLFFFVTLNIFVFCSIVKRSETKFLNWMYIISGLIAVNSNYICALIFIPQFWLLYNYNNGKKVFYRKKTWVVSVFIIVFITVLIFCIFKNFSAKKLFLPIPTVNLYQLIISFISVNGFNNNIDLLIMIFSVSIIFFILYRILKIFNRYKKSFFWNISFLVLFAFALIFAFFSEKNYDGYGYLTCSVFIFYIVFFNNVVSLKNFILKNLFISVSAVFIIYSLIIYYSHNSRPDFREAFNWLKSNSLSGEKLLSFSDITTDTFRAYKINNVESYDTMVLYCDKAVGLIFKRINNNIWVILREKYEYKVLNKLFLSYNFKLKKFFENQSNKNDFIGIYKYQK